MLNLKHKKLDVWDKSMELAQIVYHETQSFPKSELYGLVSQMRRATVSVPSNISEGAARKSLKERKRFFEIARSSLVELDTQLELAVNLGYLRNYELLNKKINIVFAQLSNLLAKAK